MKNNFRNLLQYIIKLLSNVKFNKKESFLLDEESIEILPKFTSKKLYVNSGIGLRVRSTPETINRENILGVLKYGQEVLLIEEQEKWFRIRYGGDKEGWVSSAHLTEDKPVDTSQIIKEEDFQDTKLPKFKIGVANRVNDDNTIKLRKIINDEFTGGRNGWDLQCTEYVLYRLKQAGITIQWPAERPRHGGRWADIFKRNNLYKVLNKPKVGCAMCFTAGFRKPEMNAIGHVAFVEEVLDDNSIRISEANWPLPGKYNNRIVLKSEWQDKHKCRFVDFS